MFTLKFMKHLEESGQDIRDVISAHRYERIDLQDGSAIIMVHTPHDQPNIEYRIDVDHQTTQSFHSCYIENMNGKTIDKINSVDIV